MVYDEAALRHLVDALHAGAGLPLLASYPREIVGRLVDFAGFNGVAPRLSIAAVDQAWSSMFACRAPLIAGGLDADVLEADALDGDALEADSLAPRIV